MTNVHAQISEQVKNHRQAQKEFLALDAKREQAIDRVLKEAKKGLHISVQEINSITKEMNEIASTFYFPPRKEVTHDMILDYLHRSE
ncbi:DUF2533 family protein [Bacillus sp. FJAT-45037]|uniref:DUF2533 family protein n=1 Tax=Bacillus sp. FJAT-45037 TaxID=2011007 RepID=UPI000C24AE94|nr:DUF2533 family protein [Bacillus sp. FJAT-45037]